MLSKFFPLVVVAYLQFLFDINNAQLGNWSNCEDQGLIYHHNWDDESAENVPYANYTMVIDDTIANLGITFEVELEYLGKSTARYDYGYGTTYVLDFEPFSASDDNIYEPGICANRDKDSFGANFSKYWTYSEVPYTTDHVCTTDDFMAYPTSDYWSCEMVSVNECDRVKYTATFTWDELRRECTDFGNTRLNTLVTNTEWINLTGRIYVEMVSPYQKKDDMSEYWVKDVITSVPFRISIMTSVHAIGSTGIRLFLIAVIHHQRTFYEDTTNTNGDYCLTVLTQTADYMHLYDVLILGSPFSPEYPDLDWTMAPLAGSSQSCLFQNNFVCFQTWELCLENITCPLTLNGTFSLNFNTECGTTPAEDDCTDYLDAFGDQVDLNLPWGYEDDFDCDVEVVSTIITTVGGLEFCTNDQFNILQGDNLYVAGTGRVYVKMSVVLNVGVSGTVDLALRNVLYCTIDPEYEEEVQIDPANAAESGCLNSTIVDLQGEQYLIYSHADGGDVSNGLEFELHDEGDNEVVWFSFLAPEWIGRSTLYVHAQAVLQYNDDTRRRRLLEYAVESGMQSDIGAFGLTEYETDNDNDKGKSGLDTGAIAGIVAGSCVVCILLLVIALLVRKQRKLGPVEEDEIAGHVETHPTAVGMV